MTRLPRVSASELVRCGRLAGIVFDMDGVLADTEPFHLDAWKRLLEHHLGTAPDAGLIRRTFGQTNDAIVPALWRQAGREPPDDVEALGREKEALYRAAAAGRLLPLPGLHRFLAWLEARGVPRAIATSGPPENIDFLLAEFGWRGRFQVLVDRTRFARGKPAPDGFLAAARELRAPPARLLVFEDSLHGLRAARRGGFQAAAVATTHPVRELRLLAHWVFTDFLDLGC